MANGEQLRRIESAMERMARLTRSPRAHAIRSARAGVHLTRAGENVLGQLAGRGPVRISDLARATYTGAAAVSRIVTALEDDGLVARQGAPDDGRVALVRLTAQGRGVAQRLRRATDEIFQELLADWSARDLGRAADVMEELARDLSHRPAVVGRSGPSR